MRYRVGQQIILKDKLAGAIKKVERTHLVVKLYKGDKVRIPRDRVAQIL